QNLSDQLTNLQEKLDMIIDSYPNREEIFPEAHEALKDVQNVMENTESSDLDADLKRDLLHKLEIKEEQLNEVSLVASGLEVETTLNSPVLTQGEQTTATVKVENTSSLAVEQIELALSAPDAWEVDGNKEIESIQPGETKTFEFAIAVPNDAAFYHPYDEAILQTKLSINVQDIVSENILNFEDTVAVLPDISLTTSPKNIVINTADKQGRYTVSVEAKNYFDGEKVADVSLDLPEGWQSGPGKQTVSLKERFDSEQVEFSIIPPENVEEGDFNINVKASADRKDYDATIQEISYDHINHEYFEYPAEVHVTSFELLMPDNFKIGYIESGYDEVADYLLNVGFDITKLTEDDLS